MPARKKAAPSEGAASSEGAPRWAAVQESHPDRDVYWFDEVTRDQASQ